MLVAPCSGPTWKTLPNCSTNPPLPSNSPNHVCMSLSFGFEPTISPINAYTLSGDKAASLFVKSAKCHLKVLTFAVTIVFWTLELRSSVSCLVFVIYELL